MADDLTPKETDLAARFLGRIATDACLERGVPDFAVEPMINAELAKIGFLQGDDAENVRLAAEYKKGIREALDDVKPADA